MIEQLQADDVVLVWKLDRSAHSLRDLTTLANEIQQRGAGLHSLVDCLDTTVPSGGQIFQTFIALAEFERNIIRERTKIGLRTAQAKGRKGGRPKGLSERAQHTATLAEAFYRDGKLSVTKICEQLSISRGTFYKYLRYQGVAIRTSRRKRG